MRRTLAALAVLPLLALCAAPRPSVARGRSLPPLLTLPLRVHVALCGGKAAQSDAWVAAHLQAVRRIYARHRIALSVRRDNFRPLRCVLLTRAHRHAMAAYAPTGPWATVMVLPRVRDVDVPSYDLMGVHWRYRGKRAELQGRRYVLLTGRARPPVLAHELAHFLGLRHDPAGGNLLTPGPSDPLWQSRRKPARFRPRLTASQGRSLRRGVQTLLATPLARPLPTVPRGARPAP